MVSRVRRGAVAEPRLAVTGAPIQTEAGLLAAGTKVSLGAGLVAVKPGPACLARALAGHWVAALRVVKITSALHVTLQPIETIRAHAFLTPEPEEASLTQARTINVVAACPINTVTLLAAVLAIFSNRALLAAPIPRESQRTPTLSVF